MRKQQEKTTKQRTNKKHMKNKKQWKQSKKRKTYGQTKKKQQLNNRKNKKQKERQKRNIAFACHVFLFHFIFIFFIFFCCSFLLFFCFVFFSFFVFIFLSNYFQYSQSQPGPGDDNNCRLPAMQQAHAVSTYIRNKNTNILPLIYYLKGLRHEFCNLLFECVDSAEGVELVDEGETCRARRGRAAKRFLYSINATR